MKALRKSFIAVVAAVSAAWITTPASADGGRVHRSGYPAIWQGLYAGVHIGHGESGPAEGLLGGGQVGYNWQSGAIVYGVEADVSFADISFRQNFMGGIVGGSLDWMATARGRIGILATPNVLFYGTAGVGIASASVTANLPRLVNFSIDESDADFVYGAGLEGKLTNTLSARIEYLAFNEFEIGIVRAGINIKLGN